MGGQESTAKAPRLLTEQHLRQWKTVFEHLTGLQLTREREPVVRAVLQDRIDRSDCTSADHYLTQLQNSPSFSRLEWDALIAKVVIGETRFFRYGSTFNFISRYFTEKLQANAEPSKLTAWSVGCSSGEEAYSLAMLLHNLCRGIGGSVPFSVVGTDINGVSLKHASQGIYRNILDRGVDESTASAFFDGLGNGSFRIKQFVRAKVAFFRHNMLEPVTSAVIPPMDMISCQNVLMYLQPWRRRAVIRHLIPFLKVDGVLVLCPGDLSNWKPDSLERMPVADVQAYRRRY